MNLPANEIDVIAFKHHNVSIIHSMPTLWDKLNIPIEEKTKSIEEDLPIVPSPIHNRILTSNDQIYFVFYTAEVTMKRQWYIVKVGLEVSGRFYFKYILSKLDYCLFLAKHPTDKSKSEKYSRWWPDWYMFSRDSITKSLVFGDKIFFVRQSHQTKISISNMVISLTSTTWIIYYLGFLTSKQYYQQTKHIPRSKVSSGAHSIMCAHPKVYYLLLPKYQRST